MCIENSGANEEKNTGKGEAYKIVKMLRVVIGREHAVLSSVQLVVDSLTVEDRAYGKYVINLNFTLNAS